MSYIKQADSGGGGTIGGSIANEQVAFGSGADTIEGTNDLKYVKGDAALKLAADDSGFLVGAGGSNFDSDFYFQVYGSESRVDSGLPVRIKGSTSDTKFITESSEAATGGQEIGQIQFKGLDSASNVDKFGQIQVDAESNTSGAEDASMLFKVVGSDTGVLREVVRITKSGLTLGGNTPGTQYTLPTVDGNANQVLQTDGSGTLSFASVSGGGSGEKTKNVGYLTSPIDDKSGGTDVSVYALTMATNGTSSTTAATGGYPTTFMTLVPFIVPIVPTTSSMQFSFRTGSQAGSEWGIGWYASDSDGMPNGSPFYSSVFTPTSFTTYTLNTGQLLSKGQLIWFAYFGQTTGTTLTTASSSTGMFNLLPELRASLSYLGNRATTLTTTASAATTFDSLSQSTVYDTAFVSSMIRIAMTF